MSYCNIATSPMKSWSIMSGIDGADDEELWPLNGLYSIYPTPINTHFVTGLGIYTVLGNDLNGGVRMGWSLKTYLKRIGVSNIEMLYPCRCHTWNQEHRIEPRPFKNKGLFWCYWDQNRNTSYVLRNQCARYIWIVGRFPPPTGHVRKISEDPIVQINCEVFLDHERSKHPSLSPSSPLTL